MGPDIDVATLTVPDPAAVDWAAAEANVRSAELNPYTIENWAEQAENDDCAEVTDAVVVARLMAVDAETPETVHAVMRDDLARVRGWIESELPEPTYYAYATERERIELNGGVRISASADLRHFVEALDGPYHTLGRCQDAGLFKGVDGIDEG